MATVPPPCTFRIRKFGVPPALLRQTVNLLAPGPKIDISLDRSGKAVNRKIAAAPPAVSAGAKVIDSAPKRVFAAVIASRKVQPFPLPTLVHAPSSVSASEFTSSLEDS